MLVLTQKCGWVLGCLNVIVQSGGVAESECRWKTLWFLCALILAYWVRGHISAEVQDTPASGAKTIKDAFVRSPQYFPPFIAGLAVISELKRKTCLNPGEDHFWIESMLSCVFFMRDRASIVGRHGLESLQGEVYDVVWWWCLHGFLSGIVYGVGMITPLNLNGHHFCIGVKAFLNVSKRWFLTVSETRFGNWVCGSFLIWSERNLRESHVESWCAHHFRNWVQYVSWKCNLESR